MLSKARIVLQGQSAYAHEQEALAFLRETLPDVDPYQLWELVEFLDPSTGRLFEIDAIVLGYSAIYVIEIKSGPGVYEGDTVDWRRTAPGEPSRYMDPPLKLTNFKSKVLKSLIQARLRDQIRCPWVQPLVFLSHPDAQMRFTNWGDHCVVTRKGLLEAVKNHAFPGAEPGSRLRINAPQMKAVAAALEAIGVRASKGVARVGEYELGAILEEGSGYQDRAAQHAQTPAFKRRARIYLVPQQTSVERRQQLRRAADREARLLEDVKDHRGVLRLLEYVTDSPLGPTVLFDAFDGIPLDAFLRSHPELSFDQRIELIEQMARALHYCHRKSVVHGSLCPGAVLVREGEAGALEVRLYNFQLGMGRDVTPTIHWSAMAGEPWALYQAPELRENPDARSPVSDVFSLGALAYLVLTGRPVADSVLELDQRLAREHRLDPRAAANAIPSRVAEAITLATESKPINRADDVEQWLELLLDAATAPEPEVETAEVNPLEARKGDVLGTDLTVLGVLGQGASSRVLEVERDGRALALKVALTQDDDQRLAEEGRALATLRHARIVQFLEERTLSGRTCLLLAKAGEETLQRHLASQGVVSLDYGSRFGEDLLLALEELEERQILHRDIKPANLGVGALGKKAHHLTLFDFSLALNLRDEQPGQVGRTHLSIGTAVYRDPFLRLRGAWDAAADRWSAAVTLHEMLTGVRPGFSVAGAPALEPEAEIVLAAERFDASVRDQLVPFFERALHREVSARFESATAMRKAYNRCFESTVRAPVAAPETVARAGDPEPPEPTPALSVDFTTVSPEQPIEALPLSVRARNALDRAGLTLAKDLLALPENRLSAVRGVGRLVAREIFAFRDAWKTARSLTPEPPKPFFPAYRGEDLLLGTSGLEPSAALVLRDAGLQTLSAVAQAPEQQIETLARKGVASVDAIRQVLEAENTRSNAKKRPTTVEGWIEALLPAKKAKRAQNLRVLFGLEAPFLGRVGVPVIEVARALEMTRANLYLQLGKEREVWAAHEALPELCQLAHSIVDEAGGAVPVERAAGLFTERIPSDGSSPRELLVTMAAALLRIVAQVEREEEAGLAWERLRGTPWLFAHASLLPTLEALGQLADELSARAVLASSGEVARLLSASVTGTPLEALSPERLTELATLASERAARSTRLEIYPRGLEPKRALELSGAILIGRLTPVDIQQRVLSRYPEASPLPDHPELDALVEGLGLKWDEEGGEYVRPGERRATDHTRLPSVATIPTLTSSQQVLDPRYIALEEFEERLRITQDRRTLKVLAVHAHKAAEAALALTDVLNIKRVSLDEAFSRAIRALVKELDVDPDTLYRADQVGPGGDDWQELRSVAQQAAERVARELLPAPEPLLLVQPGLLARFRLDGFLKRLLEASRDPQSAAIFLLVPSHDEAGVPRINGELTIPEVGLPQTLWVPLEWVKERRRTAA
ncbi:MAG TPA: protein kinase [Polyangiaceae bacterium]|nr:protein kinase [Polyangiaceae bacterium]